MESTEKVNLDAITQNLKIEDKAAFSLYLEEIYNDLFSRVTQNKNDEEEQNLSGLTKLVFDKYFVLPGIIGDRLFQVLDQEKKSVLSLNDFTKGMLTIFCGDYEETIKFIFDFYDIERDGQIDKEDIRVVLSYITLANSPDIKSTGLNLSYKNRVTSQEELYKILQKCFENTKNNKMNFEKFKNVIENVNSDLYLMIYLFLLENKPFTKENIESYEKKVSKNNPTESPKKPKYIASPSKKSSFSPYNQFPGRVRGRHVTQKIKNVNYEKMLELQKTPNEKKIQEKEAKRKYRKTKTVQFESNVITLQSLNDEKKINAQRVKDLTRKPEKKATIKEDELKIEPAFLQKVGNKKMDSDKKLNKIEEQNKEIDDEFDEEDNIEYDSSSDEESNEKEDSNEVLTFEGFLYKYVENKMRKLYFKLIHKDLYFYKNKGDKSHKGMHNLNGLFLQEEKPINYKGVLFYSFSLVYPSKKRIYYCNNEEEYKTWFEKLKIATGYTNLLEIYGVKQRLGKGKFGLVKLGINRNTNQPVAIKIMKKETMDTSDALLVRTEIEILKICQHPNIVRLYDVFENPDYIYIIMEYCPGGDLFTFLEKRNFILPENLISKIMHKMCTAVFYMHSYGIAHRDLKPENVLIANPDDGSDIRILDFGLSKIVGPYEKSNEPYGTLTYCAPEIILDEPYSKAVDLWSLGVMTYLMLSGRLPFSGRDENEIARRVAYEEPDFILNPIWKTISSEAKDFVKKLLEKDSAKRMNIRQALEHKFIKKYDEEKMTLKRKNSDDESKDFELYSSTTTNSDD